MTTLHNKDPQLQTKEKEIQSNVTRQQDHN